MLLRVKHPEESSGRTMGWAKYLGLPNKKPQIKDILRGLEKFTFDL